MASANFEGPTNTDMVFKGTDGNECEAFVVSIRELAFAKGKEDDCHWMLHYATTRLRGKALRWHAKLDASIRKDWDLFVQALFEEYPVVEEPDEGGIATPVWTTTTFSPALSTTTLPGNPESHIVSSTGVPQFSASENAPVPPMGAQRYAVPAVLAPRVYDSSALGLHVGRLRIVYEEGKAPSCPQYICCNPGWDLQNITINVEDALVVSFMSFTGAHEISCLNPGQPSLRRLGVRLFRADVMEYHPVVGVEKQEYPHTFSSRDTSVFTKRYQMVSSIWNILGDGTLQATLADLTRDERDRETVNASEVYLTSIVYVDISGQTISFAKDYSPPHKFHPESNLPILRARIVFEPL